MPPGKGPKTVYVVSQMPPERSGVGNGLHRTWDAANYLFGRRNCGNGSSGGVYLHFAGGRVTCGSAKECRRAALDEWRFGGYTVSIPLVLNRLRANSCGDCTAMFRFYTAGES